MIINFDQGIFSMTLEGCAWTIGSLREECEKKARILYEENPNIMVAVSGGLDCQVVLHSFFSQGIPVKAAFLSLNGYNDFEKSNVLKLKEKYNLDLTIINIDPDELKDELIEEYKQNGIPPFQLMHAGFLEQVPEDHTFIQGLDGPEFYRKNDKWYLLETANSFGSSRTRALQQVKRTGKIVNWEKTAEIYYNILKDDVITAYHNSYDYIVNNGLCYKNGAEIKVVNHWDLYMKPLVYAKYWGKDLEYFGKYQGPENISWIMDVKWHRYDLNMIFIPVDEAMKVFSTPGAKKTFIQRSTS